VQAFRNRDDAGRQLAEVLAHQSIKSPAVLGLVRGGIVVASHVASRLGARLDALVARKVGAPGHPEFGIGAIAPAGVQVFDLALLERLGITQAEFAELAKVEEVELKRRMRLYRGTEEPPSVGGTAIIVDDGLATGVTALAAVRFVRSLSPARIVVAAPVCSPAARFALEPEVDELVCLDEPQEFYAVGQFYEDFTQVEDDDVLSILKEERI